MEIDKVRAGLQQAKDEDRELDDTTARIIASWWHGGQTSGLYSFVSTGAIVAGLYGDEVSENYPTADRENREFMDWLGTYFLRNGVRGPQEGWSERTHF